jgi:hypothetical protein
MAINIQEQFNVNIGLPIDSRIVASGSTARNAITYKYDGLVVYDTSDRKTYAWNSNNSSWSLTDISGAGTTNAIPKWSSSSGLTSSGIYMIASSGANGKVGINTASPNEVFQINSISGGSQPFVIHKGSFNNIIGSNWYNTGSDAYYTGTDGSGIIKFKPNGEIVIHNRASSNFTPLNSGDTFNSFTTLTMGPDRIGLHRNTYFSNNGLTITSAAYIRALNNFSTKTTPDYTWWNDDMTGIYHPSDNKIAFSVEGEQKAILTLNGLAITATDNVTSPASRLHLDSGNSSASYIQFTSGTLTGTSATNGVLIGINSAGYAVLQSRYLDSPFLFVFTSGNSHHAIRKNKLVTYSWSNGENFATVSASNGGSGSRTERISIERVDTNVSGSTTQNIYDLSVPSNTYVSIEATFTSTMDPSSGSTQYRTCKILSSFKCDSGGNITAFPSGTTTIANISSQSAANIAVGYAASSALNTLRFSQIMGIGTHDAYIVLDIVAVFNVNVGN